MSRERMLFYDYCVTNNKLALLDEWDKEKNEELTPHNVSYKSDKKVWWRCSRGHGWQARVGNRTSGTGCPHCKIRRGIEYNNLATAFPEVAAQWHPTLNEGLSPESIAPHSDKKVWWRCSKGHEWQARVANRTSGTGCPYCKGKHVAEGFFSLATVAPEVAAQWHPAKNGDLTPETILAHSSKKVWWRCSKGHEWQTKVAHRTSGTGCPFCFSKTRQPILAKHREMLREAKEKLGKQD